MDANNGSVQWKKNKRDGGRLDNNFLDITLRYAQKHGDIYIYLDMDRFLTRVLRSMLNDVDE